MKITVGNGHTTIELKNIIKEFVEGKGYEVIDLGANSTESYDYPICGEKVGQAVANGQADLGITICGTGVGISLAANEIKGIRTCVRSEPYTAKLFRVYSNSSVFTFGARVVGSELAEMIAEAWLDAEFGDGKRKRRVNMIMEIENR